jgi:hypothetical protein
MIKSRRMRCVRYVIWMEEMRNAHKILVGKPEGRDHSEDQGVDGKIILKFMFGAPGGWVWAGFAWLRIRTRGGLL